MRRFNVAVLFIVFYVSAWGTEDFDRQQIIERIKPLGQVRLEDSADEQQRFPTKSAQEEAGRATYEKYCVMCHQNGLAGAPKFRVVIDWQARVAQKKLNGLITSAIEGVNAMPPNGSCMDCTEAELKEAIEYMLPKS